MSKVFWNFKTPPKHPKARVVKVCRQMSQPHFKSTPEQPQRNCSQQIIRKSIKMRNVEQRRNACRHPEYMAVNQKGGATALIFPPSTGGFAQPLHTLQFAKMLLAAFPFSNPLRNFRDRLLKLPSIIPRLALGWVSQTVHFWRKWGGNVGAGFRSGGINRHARQQWKN